MEAKTNRKKTLQFRQNQVLFREGDPGTYALLVTKGEVELRMTDKRGREKTVSRAGEGEVLGIGCLVSEKDMPRIVTAVAFTDVVETVYIPREYFLRHIEKLPVEVKKVMNMVLKGYKKAADRVAFLT